MDDPLGRWSGAVVVVGDMLAPRDGAALVVNLLHREVGHEAVGAGTLPVASPASKKTRSPGRIS